MMSIRGMQSERNELIYEDDEQLRLDIKTIYNNHEQLLLQIKTNGYTVHRGSAVNQFAPESAHAKSDPLGVP